MRTAGRRLHVQSARTKRSIGSVTGALLLACAVNTANAQTPDPQSPDPETRQAATEQAQADKALVLRPFEPRKAEQVMGRVERILLNPAPKWHPYFESAYLGGGFAVGAGYFLHVRDYDTVDFRGSYTLSGYKRLEAEFLSPRLFKRRSELSVVGGWREATEVGFYGTGNNSSQDNHPVYGFRQPYGSALLTVRPTRRLFLLRGGVELSRWNLDEGSGSHSIEDDYSPETLPGVAATTTYLHTQATAGFDSRPAKAYARRGGFYGVTAHDFHDPDDKFGFRKVDYEAIQHLPILRESWVLSLHAKVETSWANSDQQVPFFMLPSLGGGTDLRGFASWRFRDRHSLLLQGEWRIMVNRFLDTAIFYDAGKVASRTADLDLSHMKTDYGFGARFHGPFATALRLDLARSSEGTRLVFASSAAF